jgi:hypothetical protein
MMLCIPDPERGPPRWQRHPGVSANALTTPPARPNTVNVRTSAAQGVQLRALLRKSPDAATWVACQGVTSAFQTVHHRHHSQ